MALLVEDVVSMVLFARVVEERSFTAAAARLGMRKSTVSRRLAALEKDLGVRLLHRTTRRLSLTDAGLAFYERCARVTAEADAAAALAQGLGGAPHGTLRVNGPSMLGTRHLAPAVGAFLQEFPQLKVELSVSDAQVDVLHGGYDVVVRVARKGPLKAEASIAARRLATDRLVVCASPAYLRGHPRPELPEDLAQHHCLRYAQNAPHQEWRFMRDGEAAYVPVPSSFSSNNGEVLRSAALAGLGLAVLPHFSVVDALASGALVEVLPEFRPAELVVWALTPERQGTPARARAFVDFLAARFRKGLGVPL
jgi:DNA-binding transcriptional LysR family regulator